MITILQDRGKVAAEGMEIEAIMSQVWADSPRTTGSGMLSGLITEDKILATIDDACKIQEGH